MGALNCSLSSGLGGDFTKWNNGEDVATAKWSAKRVVSKRAQCTVTKRDLDWEWDNVFCSGHAGYVCKVPATCPYGMFDVSIHCSI